MSLCSTGRLIPFIRPKESRGTQLCGSLGGPTCDYDQVMASTAEAFVLVGYGCPDADAMPCRRAVVNLYMLYVLVVNHATRA
jgi:hypothetical protein